MYWSAGLSLISNIPRKGHWPVKTHAWINAGRLDTIDRCECSNIYSLVLSGSVLILFSAPTSKQYSLVLVKAIHICRNRLDIPLRPSESRGKFRRATCG